MANDRSDDPTRVAVHLLTEVSEIPLEAKVPVRCRPRI
jgi:hypothetical protein